MQLPNALTELLVFVSYVVYEQLPPNEAVVATMLLVFESINRLLVAHMFLLGTTLDLDFLIVKFTPVAVQLLLMVSKHAFSLQLVLLKFLFKFASRAVLSVP